MVNMYITANVYWGNNKINLSIVHLIPLLRNRRKIANCSYIAIVGSFVFLSPTK